MLGVLWLHSKEQIVGPSLEARESPPLQDLWGEGIRVLLTSLFPEWRAHVAVTAYHVGSHHAQLASNSRHHENLLNPSVPDAMKQEFFIVVAFLF